MGEINLTDINKDTFGSRLPNVFIQQITVDYDDGLADFETEARIKAKLNIKFTKPAHLQHKTVESFIEEYLADLYLYAYMPYQTRVYQQLQNNTFKMLEWMKYQTDHVHHSWRDNNNYKIALSTLIAETDTDADEDSVPDSGNIYNSKLVTNSSFDSEGNEIIEISNITLDFYAENKPAADPPTPSISDIAHLTLVAAVGFHSSPLRKADRFGDHASYLGDESTYPYKSDIEFDDEGEIDTYATINSPEFFNRNFGNITYYHILEYGEVSPRFYQVYTTPDGAAYYEQVLQSLNGKFYATDGYSFESLQASFQTIIDNYESSRQADSILNNNIGGLEAIIYAERNKVNVLGEIANYRSTYPNKDQGTNSGLFYNDFVVIFAEVIQSVQAQTEISSKMMFDSLVIDKRSSLLSAGGWTLPTFDTDGTFPKYKTMLNSDNYIPRHQFHMVRKAMRRDTFSGGTADAAERRKIYGSDVIGEGLRGAGQDTAMYLDYSLGANQADYNSLYLEFLDFYTEQGYSASAAAELAQEELDYQLSTGETGIATELLNPSFDGGNLGDLFPGDVVVRNKGWWFFDYEKALRNTTNLTGLLQLEKLQKYFRINVPYEAYYYKYAHMSRKELPVGTSDSEWVRPSMYTLFYKPNIDTISGLEQIDTMMPKEQYYQIKLPSGFDHADTSDGSRFKYGRPAVFSGGVRYTSIIRPRNFDLPTNDVTKRLEGFNNLDSVLSWDNFESSRVAVMDGYRLQCFDFVDFMDDDVAYYNSTLWAEEGSTRSDQLKSLNGTTGRNHPGTTYKLSVQMIDLTTNVYCDFLNTVLEVYNAYLEYVGLATEICSFNNITNSYNQFFIDKINEAHPDKPWIIAAYYAVGVSDMLFGGPTAITEESYRQRVIKEVMKISPETGNLEQTIEFARIFNTLLQYLSPDVEPLDEDTSEPVTTNGTPGTSFSPESVERTYSNFVPIPPTIYGDIAPDFIEGDLFQIREPMPIPVTLAIWDIEHQYVYRGTADDPDRILNGISYEQMTRYIWERIFYTGYGGATRKIMYPNDIYIGAHWGPDEYLEGRMRAAMLTSVYDSETGMLDLTSPAGLLGSASPHHKFTGLSYLINRICKNFSIDAEVTLDGAHARRKPGGSDVLNMRQYRTLNSILYILKEYMLPECDRRVRYDGINYVDEGVHGYMRSKADTLTIPTGDRLEPGNDRGYYYSELVMGHYTPIISKMIIEFAIEQIDIQINPVRGEVEYDVSALDGGIDVGGLSGGSHGVFGYIVDDDFRLREIVSADNPEGSDNFNEVLT